MIATTATDGEYTDAEHYATMMAEDNEDLSVDFIHGGDEDCAPFFVLEVDGTLSEKLTDWARIMGWHIADVRTRYNGGAKVRFTETEEV